MVEFCKCKRSKYYNKGTVHHAHGATHPCDFIKDFFIYLFEQNNTIIIKTNRCWKPKPEMKLWMMEVKTKPKPKMRWKLRRSRAVMNKMKPTDGIKMMEAEP